MNSSSPRKPRKPQPPKGFAAVNWEDLPVNAVAFRRSNPDEPYRVVDPQDQLVQKLTSTVSEVITDNDMLVQNGPVGVLVRRGHNVIGFYTDFPMTLYVYDPVDDKVTKTRPKSLDGMPGDADLALRTKIKTWPPLYGTWTAVEVAAPVESHSFTLTNRMSVNALTAELVRMGRSFQLEANLKDAPTCWVLTVSQADYQWLLAACQDRIAGEEA